MHCIVRSADRMIIDGDAKRIVARSPHGEFAVMDSHAPILAVLVASVVRVLIGGEEQVIAIKGGTFNMADNHATILVERPYKLEEIDIDDLTKQLATLQTHESSTAAMTEEIAYLELLRRVKETHA